MKKTIYFLLIILLSGTLSICLSTAHNPEGDISIGWYYGINNNMASSSVEDSNIEGESAGDFGVFGEYIIHPNDMKIGINLDIGLRYFEAKDSITTTTYNPFTGEVDSSNTEETTYETTYLNISISGRYYITRMETIEPFGIEPYVGAGLAPQIIMDAPENWSSLLFGFFISGGAEIELASGFAIAPELRFQLNLNSVYSVTPDSGGEETSLGFNNFFIMFPIKITP